MRVALTEEIHNHVDWESRSPVVWTELGLLAFAAIACVLVIYSPSPWRWYVVASIGAVVLAIGIIIAATNPIVDRGHLERLPEGGDLKRTRTWLLVGARIVVDEGLDTIERFSVEEAAFEDVPPAVYRRARLWAVLRDGSQVSLTDWAEVDSVAELGAALERAARREVV